MDRRDIDEKYARETGKTEHEEGRDSARALGTVMVITCLVVAGIAAYYAVDLLIWTEN